ncbi:MAG: excisionase family DNA-binding protein [Ruminococcus sp.]|nr:excisionase family DNA-binding protein [Ruminococcus sp.]
MKDNIEVPIYEKQNLTIEEAAEYSNIGQNKLRELTAEENCRFVLWVGTKRLIKRKLFDDFITNSYSI